MPRIAGEQQMSYKPAFFSWLRRQLIVVEDWPYSGTDFRGDPDMPLPEGEDYDGDVGPERPAGTSLIARRVARQFDVAPYQEGSDNDEEIARNPEGFTHGILEYARMGDAPRQYQRHTVGVSDRIR